jgi:pyruvate dehydrogenase E1 component
MYRYASSPLEGDHPRAQILVSGITMTAALKAQRLLAEEWGVAADVWSVTSWNELRRDAVVTEKWNLTHPREGRRSPYVTTALDGAPGPVIAVSDYMRAVQDQIAQWVHHTWCALGTDGFGFADTRAAARRYFLVDAESIVVATLQSLARDELYDPDAAGEAFDRYRLGDPTAVAGVAQEGASA